MESYTRYEFSDIFQQNSDGSLYLKVPIEINDNIFSSGNIFQKGVIVGGIDFHLYQGRGIAVLTKENNEGPLEIYGFYPN